MAGDSDEHALLDPIEGTTENADYVSNRNAGSRAMWSAKAEEEQAAKVKAGEVAKPVQYSVCLGMRSIGWLTMLICA